MVLVVTKVLPSPSEVQRHMSHFADSTQVVLIGAFTKIKEKGHKMQKCCDKHGVPLRRGWDN